MSHAFEPHEGLIIVHAEIVGISGSAILRLALDTGATTTLINSAMLVSIGYDPALAPERVQITTGSGLEFVPRLVVKRLIALGNEQNDLLVLGHTLPPSAGIDGLLGLDFLRGKTLRLNFKNGAITLESD